MKYLGIDFGLRRVGLAQSEGQIAAPLKILEGRNFKELVDLTVKLAKDGEYEILIVGVPEGKIGELAQKFIKELRKVGLAVVEVDETLSTRKAESLMLEMGLSRKKRKFSDAQAAAEILQDYLDREGQS